MSSFSYKLPFGYLIVLFGVSSVFPLGSFGYIDDSFPQSQEARIWSFTIYFGCLFYALTMPRNKKIHISERGISIPGVFFPPYRTSFTKWTEVREVRVRTNKSDDTLILQTRNGTVKIHSLLCFKDFELSLHSEDFDKIVEFTYSKSINRKP